ncbi:MAG: heavy-metal-associated domain-containing protein [Deltaproteobacteria bacterium]|nr:heavy-metal-associated domain-containing protein [Deltaproteobacteria bacterium]
MIRKILVVVFGLVILSPVLFAAEKKLDCKVEKMSCAMCEKKINRTLTEEVPGVLKSDIKSDAHGGIVTIDPAKTTPLKVMEAINKLGFEAKECKAI